jgi:hypothetical protein
VGSIHTRHLREQIGIVNPTEAHGLELVIDFLPFF